MVGRIGVVVGVSTGGCGLIVGPAGMVGRRVGVSTGG